MAKDNEDVIAALPSVAKVTKQIDECKGKAKALRDQAQHWDRQAAALRHVLRAVQRADGNRPVRKRGPRKTDAEAGDGEAVDDMFDDQFGKMGIPAFDPDEKTHEEAAALA